ncbi:hypothetical protein Glove_297g6 [Diversispora epigaea]|uniref:Uncharacterized protein n=1 Tax=Diversispora epigaea TaxID=1348612 RepID=A0A397I3W8_9GLOM|nr:hypothetical protein Glove_297g6 [Diversispora epigaea]
MSSRIDYHENNNNNNNEITIQIDNLIKFYKPNKYNNYKSLLKHPEAIYTSRHLDYSSLPKPKNDENFEKELEGLPKLTSALNYHENNNNNNNEITIQIDNLIKFYKPNKYNNYKSLLKHPEAIYTSRHLDYSSLPKPKNDENFEKELEGLPKLTSALIDMKTLFFWRNSSIREDPAMKSNALIYLKHPIRFRSKTANHIAKYT